MTTMQEATMALLRKLVDADTQGIAWEVLSSPEQHLAKQLDNHLVDFEPRWVPDPKTAPGKTAMMAEGQRVLATQRARMEVLRSIIGDLLQPHVGYVTREQVLGACHKRGIKVTGALLDQVVLHLDCLPDGKAHLHEFVVDASHEPGRLHYTFSRQ